VKKSARYISRLNIKNRSNYSTSVSMVCCLKYTN
jgi:hypothetical protein